MYDIARHTAVATFILCGSLAHAQPVAEKISSVEGEMTVSVEAGESNISVNDTLRFEPWQMIDEMFTRSDVVYLMRHGPTNWSDTDIKNVAPTDCENQRLMTSEGKLDMQTLGILMADNDIAPGQIIVSEWCRNQETLENLKAGFAQIDAEYAANVPVETEPQVNLLLSLQGAPDVSVMRERISAWDGGDDTGPLLIISHYTNIEELTNFRIYEGEILIVDPKRENRVIGYLRLKSAGPDTIHFDASLQN